MRLRIRLRKKKSWFLLCRVCRAAPWVLLLGVIFIAVNMRAPLTSVGPLIEMIRNHLQLSNTMAKMITTLPLLFIERGSYPQMH